jgi:hypothetical protein
MWCAVLFLALAAAQDPVRIGIMAFLVSRPRPMPNLFVYWLGLTAAGYGAALAALFLPRDFMVPVMRVVTSAATSPIVPPIQIAIGVLVVSSAAVLAVPTSVRQAADALVPGSDPPALVPHPKTPTIFSQLLFPRLSWTALLEGRSLGMAFVVGVFTSTQILEFCGAMLIILASGAGVGTQISVALMFTLVACAVVEIPLVSHLVSPAKTQAVVMQLHGWLRAHRRPVLAVILAVVGVLMVAYGVGRL